MMLMLCIVPAATVAQTLEEQRRAVQGNVSSLQEKLADTIEKYGYACDRLAATKAAIAENEAKLEAAEVELAQSKDNLNARVRAMYVNPGTGFIEVLVNAGGFDEFLVGIDLVKKIGDRDAKLVRQVKDAKLALENARADLLAQKEQQAAAAAEMASAKASVESQLASAKGQLGNIESQIQAALAQRQAAASGAARSSGASRAPVYSPTVSSNPGMAHPGVVNVAAAQIGKPYVWGATGPNSFDCSGLVYYSYLHGAGITVPRTSYSQAGCGSAVSVGQLSGGDIVGFRGWGHVGIYAGGGSFIHAPSSGSTVRAQALSSRGDYSGARRP